MKGASLFRNAKSTFPPPHFIIIYSKFMEQDEASIIPILQVSKLKYRGSHRPEQGPDRTTPWKRELSRELGCKVAGEEKLRSPC